MEACCRRWRSTNQSPLAPRRPSCRADSCSPLHTRERAAGIIVAEIGSEERIAGNLLLPCSAGEQSADIRADVTAGPAVISDDRHGAPVNAQVGSADEATGQRACNHAGEQTPL